MGVVIWVERSVIIAYVIQCFQKFFIYLFLLLSSPYKDRGQPYASALWERWSSLNIDLR